jgi:hypothetical protein
LNRNFMSAGNAGGDGAVRMPVAAASIPAAAFRRWTSSAAGVRDICMKADPAKPGSSPTNAPVSFPEISTEIASVK